MNKINTGGPAFPHEYFDKQLNQVRVMHGMTLRDYFAAKAMQFEFKDYWDDFAKRKDQTIDEYWRNDIAESCYAMADAMLTAREA